MMNFSLRPTKKAPAISCSPGEAKASFRGTTLVAAPARPLECPCIGRRPIRSTGEHGSRWADCSRVRSHRSRSAASHRDGSSLRGRTLPGHVPFIASTIYPFYTPASQQSQLFFWGAAKIWGFLPENRRSKRADAAGPEALPVRRRGLFIRVYWAQAIPASSAFIFRGTSFALGPANMCSIMARTVSGFSAPVAPI